MEKIVLLGSGGHAKSVVDTILAGDKYEITGFVDPMISDFEYLGYKIIGCDDDLPSIYREGVHCACVCIGFMGRVNMREALYSRLKRIGFLLPAIVDPTAVLAKNVYLGEGTFVGKGVVINSGVTIGKMAIINTAAVIEHDCKIGDFTHIAVGAVICGAAQVGRAVLVGANATVLQEISIGAGAVIGGGGVVIRSIFDEGIYVGNPVRKVK